MPETMTEAQRALRERVEAFVEHELMPLEQGLPEAQDAPVPETVRLAVVTRARSAGIYGALQPDEHGGDPTGPVERVLVVEALARSNLRLARLALGPGPGMLAGVQGPLRERYLLPLLAGEKRSALAITESRDGKSPTIAERRDGMLRIRGKKSYVTGGADADFYLVWVELTGAAHGAEGRALVIVDRDTPGLSIERAFRSLDGSHHVQLAFDEVAIPESQRLPETNARTSRTQAGLTALRLLVAARASGAALWAVEHASQRLAEPRKGGPPLGDNDAVRLRLADMGIATYAARSVLYRTARLLAHGDDARNQAMVAKVLCTESAVQAIDRAIALEGGQALVVGHPLERLHRELQALLLAEGASDVLRQSLAKGMLEHGFSKL
jgi:acyl-CoA dehydrogenase